LNDADYRAAAGDEQMMIGGSIPMSKPEEQSQTRASTRLLRLGWAQFGVIAAAVAFVLGVGAVLLYPALHLRYIQEFGIRQFETQYEFRSGDVLVTPIGQQPRTEWGIVWVAPAGAFSRLGIRAGDVPFEYHGGIRDMYVALQKASEGEATSFQVYNAADAHLGRKALRDIHVPPAVRSAPH
jgi:hypothetical protein